MYWPFGGEQALAGYSRGFTVKPKGAWAQWTCEREGCDAKGTGRGDQADDKAAWAAAAHQQEDHLETVIREAAQALRDAASVLGSASLIVTDIDAHSHRGTARVTPEAAGSALGSWAWQLLSPLPEPEDPDARNLQRLDQDFAQRDVCNHDSRPGRPVCSSAP
jgi:hypothetical protein